MNNYCWFKTKLNSNNIVDPNWKFETKLHYVIKYDKVPVTDEFIKYLKQFDLVYANNMMFYRAPNSHPFGSNTLTSHVDLDHKNNLCSPALNYIIGGKNSYMNWFKMPSENYEVKFTPANTAYCSFHNNELEKIDEGELGEELTLVRVDIPHNVIVNSEARLCISIRFQPIEYRKWEDVVDFFNERNLLIQR
jgi:hypothetical protein